MHDIWAVQYIYRLLVKLGEKGVVLSFHFLAFLSCTAVDDLADLSRQLQAPVAPPGTPPPLLRAVPTASTALRCTCTAPRATHFAAYKPTHHATACLA